MSFLDLFFHKPYREETGELRDRLIVAETENVLLKDIVSHMKVRPVREPRKDKREIAEGRAARAAFYADRFKDLTPEQRTQFKDRASRRERG